MPKEISSEERDLINFFTKSKIPFSKERNEEYETLQRFLIEYKKTKDLKIWFCELMNENYKMHSKLSPVDIPSFEISFDNELIDELRKKYGHQYKRAVVIVQRIDFQQLFYRLTGIKGGTAGCVIHLGQHLPIIISSNDLEFIYHELRHSIDMYLEFRKYPDNIINECIGFYGSVIRPKIITTTSIQKNREGVITNSAKSERIIRSSLKKVKEALKSQTYYKQFKSNETFENYCIRLDKFFEILKSIEDRLGQGILDKIFFHSRKIEDITRIYEQLK